MRPKVGLKPTHPQNAAGMRTLPPVSLPVAASAQLRGHGRRGAAARSARDARAVDGIARGAEERIDRRHAAAELVGVGLAEQHGAGAFELLHDGGVVVGDVFLEQQRAGGGAHAPGLEEILVRDRECRTGPAGASPHRRHPCKISRLAAREVAGDRDEGVEILIELGDARQIRVGELQRRDLALRQPRRRLRDGQRSQIVGLRAALTRMLMSGPASRAAIASRRFMRSRIIKDNRTG